MSWSQCFHSEGQGLISTRGWEHFVKNILTLLDLYTLSSSEYFRTQKRYSDNQRTLHCLCWSSLRLQALLRLWKLPNCQAQDPQGKGHGQGCLQLLVGSPTSLVDSHSSPVPSATQVLRDKTPACLFKSSKNLQCWLILPKFIPHSHSVSLFAQRPILDITFFVY